MREGPAAVRHRLSGRGRIVAPKQACTCFFQPRCTNEDFCLETLRPGAVREAVQGLLAES